VASVRDAIWWIWSGKQDRIIARQGDIALATGRGKYRLPSGHTLTTDATGRRYYGVTHATHPVLPAPGKGQTILIARRAATHVNGGTRD
jgi:hypothetical protein